MTCIIINGDNFSVTSTHKLNIFGGFQLTSSIDTFALFPTLVE